MAGRLRALAERLARREHGLDTVVNTPPERVHRGNGGVNTLSAGDTKDLGAKIKRVHLFIPMGDEQMNTLPEHEHATEHGVNTCRRCGERMRWPAPDGVVYADGTAEHHTCRIWAAADRGLHSADALGDEAEVMLRGEAP
jgi:hypothetical protein